MLTFYNPAIEGRLDHGAAILRTGQVQMRPVLIDVCSRRASRAELKDERLEPAE